MIEWSQHIQMLIFVIILLGLDWKSLRQPHFIDGISDNRSPTSIFVRGETQGGSEYSSLSAAHFGAGKDGEHHGKGMREHHGKGGGRVKDGPGHPREKRHGHHGKRIAAIWTYTTDVSFYFELTVATLINSGADNVDVHVIVPSIPERYQRNEINLNKTTGIYAHLYKQIFFHEITTENWIQRVEEKLHIQLDYDFKNTHRKLADLKPMYGMLLQDLIPMEEYGYWIYGDSDGFFGSYNQLVDSTVLPYYDVISGFPLAPPDVQVLAGTPLRCTGAWTMWRNSPKINTIFMRSVNWEKMLKDGREVYAFDEQTRPKLDGEESVNQVLEFSHDVRQCCINNRIPSVRRGPNAIFIAEMTNRFLEHEKGKEHNGTLTYRWASWQGATITVDGPFGFGNQYKHEVARPLFLHFLQWKYCCGSQLDEAIRSFLRDLEQRGKTPFDVECFTLVAQNPKRVTMQLC